MKRKKIALSPELEAVAGEWDVLERVEGAKKFRKWARQLEVTAFILGRTGGVERPSSPYTRLRSLRRSLSKPAKPRN